jgi:Septum formation
MGRGLAIAGVVSSAVVIGALTVRAITDDDAERDVFDLRAGDCFDDPPEDEERATVSAVPCTEPHDAEVYAELESDEASDGYPGESVLIAEAERGCAERFEPFAGIADESTTLAIHYLVPTRLSWESVDDREITCIVADPAGPTTGSLAGSAR